MSVNPTICNAALFHMVLCADQQSRVVKKMKMKLWCWVLKKGRNC